MGTMLMTIMEDSDVWIWQIPAIPLRAWSNASREVYKIQ